MILVMALVDPHHRDHLHVKSFAVHFAAIALSLSIRLPAHFSMINLVNLDFSDLGQLSCCDCLMMFPRALQIWSFPSR